MRQQYESVFSNPIEEMQILDADQFFNIASLQGGQQEQESKLEQDTKQMQKLECSSCAQEIVHICQEDQVDIYTAHPGDEMNSSSNVAEQTVLESVTNEPEIDNCFFDYEDVLQAIEEIPNSASPGPDGVPPCLLKRAKTSISRMLEKVFKTSIEDGDIPEVLKLAFVTPVYKGGSRAKPVQYMPISQTSHVIKVLERVLRKSQSDLDRMYRWAEDNNMTFNGSKFQLMRYGRKENIKEDTIYFINNMEEVIEEFEEIKDLDVIIYNKADFE